MDISKQERLLCSTWAKGVGLSAAGTAGSYEGFLVLEWPLPWPRDASEIPPLSEVTASAKKLNIRVQLITEGDRSGQGNRLMRLACYHGLINFPTLGTADGAMRDVGTPFYSGFGLIEAAAPKEGVPETAFRILSLIETLKEKKAGFSQDPPGVGTGRGFLLSGRDEESLKTALSLSSVDGGMRSRPSLDEDVALRPYEGTSVREVLLCTHGKRDRCCGSLGINLYGELSGGDLFGGETGRRLYRTSHTAGHRFAPTAVFLPQGSLWAFLDGRTMGLILSEHPDCSALKPYFRGSVGLKKSEFQVVEAELFAEWSNLFPGQTGWDFLHSPRRASLAGDTVTFEVISPLTGSVQISAEIKESRKVPAWDCGQIPGEEMSGGNAKEAYTEYTVTALETGVIQSSGIRE